MFYIYAYTCVHLSFDDKIKFVLYPILQSKWWTTVHSHVLQTYKKQAYDNTGFNVYTWETRSSNSEGTDNRIFRAGDP